MAQLIPSQFCLYSLTEEETLAGQILNTSQKMVLQNSRTDIAQQILNLEASPDSYNTFIQQDGYLKGQLAILNYLLDASDAAEVEILARAQET